MLRILVSSSVGVIIGNWIFMKCCYGLVLLIVVVFVRLVGICCKVVENRMKFSGIWVQVKVVISISMVCWLVRWGVYRFGQRWLRKVSKLVIGLIKIFSMILIIILVMVQGQMKMLCSRCLVCIFSFRQVVSFRVRVMVSRVLLVVKISVVCREVQKLLLVRMCRQLFSLMKCELLLNGCIRQKDQVIVLMVGYRKNRNMISICGVVSSRGNQWVGKVGWIFMMCVSVVVQGNWWGYR